jgi:hypothetical protein
MTTPSEPPEGSDERPVDLSKSGPSAADPNDPYRFGLPDKLPPPEYAPPGWVPPGGWPAPGAPQPGVHPPPGSAPPPGYPPQPPPGYPPPGYPPQPPPYGYRYGPPPPNYSPYQVPRRGRGKAVAALVLGLLSIVMFWTAFFDSVLIIAAVAFGVVALTERTNGSASPRGMAIGGLVCAAIAALLATIWTVFLLHGTNQCGGFGQSGQPGFRTCVQNHVRVG